MPSVHLLKLCCFFSVRMHVLRQVAACPEVHLCTEYTVLSKLY